MRALITRSISLTMELSTSVVLRPRRQHLIRHTDLQTPFLFSFQVAGVAKVNSSEGQGDLLAASHV
jgi:hypothetical protein